MRFNCEERCSTIIIYFIIIVIIYFLVLKVKKDQKETELEFKSLELVIIKVIPSQ